jgi:hypothetical protein
MAIRKNHAFRSFNVCLANFSKFGIRLPELDNDYMLIIKKNHAFRSFNVSLANFSKFEIRLPELDNDYMLIIKTQNTYTYFFDTQAHTISTF